MENEKMKQYVYDGTYQQGSNILENENIKPHKIIVSAPFGTWIYINNDISPIVINETERFVWDLTNFGIIQNLYFVFPDGSNEKLIVTVFYYAE